VSGFKVCCANPSEPVSRGNLQGTLSNLTGRLCTLRGVDRPPRVLVVEDDDNIRFVAVGALRLGAFDVTEASTGRDALARVSEPTTEPDLVVLDVMLPDLDGFEVCRRMRTAGIDVPIMFLTARDATEDRLRGLTIGGDDYVTKPFSVEELVARVQVILRRVGKSPRGQVIQIGDIALDDDARVVRKDGVEVSLSPTEYKLLRFLMRNEGRAMSRGQILDHVWDYDFEGESTVVETFVSSLRRKIDSDGSHLIHTVRGVGYRLQSD
jgi:two-component system OmpR family response regulator